MTLFDMIAIQLKNSDKMYIGQLDGQGITEIQSEMKKRGIHLYYANGYMIRVGCSL